MTPTSHRPRAVWPGILRRFDSPSRAEMRPVSLVGAVVEGPTRDLECDRPDLRLVELGHPDASDVYLSEDDAQRAPFGRCWSTVSP